MLQSRHRQEGLICIPLLSGLCQIVIFVSVNQERFRVHLADEQVGMPMCDE